MTHITQVEYKSDGENRLCDILALPKVISNIHTRKQQTNMHQRTHACNYMPLKTSMFSFWGT